KKKNNQDASSELAQMKEVSTGLGETESEKTQTEEKFYQLLLVLPNMLDESVPTGKNESANIMVRKNGSPRKFDFAPKDHVDIATALDLVDLERAAKVSGARFYFLKNELVKMNHALVQF